MIATILILTLLSVMGIAAGILIDYIIITIFDIWEEDE